MASWGKFPLLEDVAVLTLLRFFKYSHAIGVPLDGEDKKKLDFSSKALSDSRYSANKATHLPWVKGFEEDEGRKSKI